MSIADELMQQIDGLFNTLDARNFETQITNEVIYEAEGMGNGNIQPSSFLADGSIDDIAAYAASIRPPAVVSSLPTLPDPDYPEGTYAFLTTTSELYVNVADVWTLEDGSTITNGILIAGLVRAAAISTEQLAADAVIANVANVANTVIIDSTGITILDGALTFEDDFGATVLSGAGFGSTWLDFISSMFYNGAFGVGTTTNMVGTTIIGTAGTTADYNQSLSSIVPYWVIDDVDVTGGGTFHREADSTAMSGWCLEVDGDALGSLFQDIPIVPNQQYNISLLWRYNATAASFNLTGSTQFRDADHGAIGSPLDTSLNFNNATEPTYIFGTLQTNTGIAPANARFLRVRMEIDRVSGSPNVKVAALKATPINHQGNLMIDNGSLLLEDGAGIEWGGAGGVTLVGTDSSDKVTLAGALLHVTRTTDATLAGSGTGALVLGDLAGLNLVMDGNEIMARDNGAASELFLNNDGGPITTGSGTFTTGGNLQTTGHMVLVTGSDGYLQFPEKAQGSGDYAAVSGAARLYVLVVAGKAQLRVRFETGAVQTIATEP